MGQVLHGYARTTEAVRREIQNSKEGVEALSERLGLSYKTVLKWKSRDFVHDMPMGQRSSFYGARTQGRSDLRSFSQALFAAIG